MKKLQYQNIFLIGPMGAGKSSVGKHLAAQLNMDFYDSDEEIEKRTGVDIGWIFDLEGPDGFCKREIEVINELAVLPNIVLSTGGGSVVATEVQATLRKNGLIILLDVSLEYQYSRTINESRRPLLRVHNREEVLRKLYAERNPIYESLADYRVLTDNRSVYAVTEDIMRWLGKR
jgi:shikimate kinase